MATELEIAQQAEREFRMYNRPRTAEAVEARTNSRFLRHLFIPAVLLVLGVIGGTALAQHMAAGDTAADWTVPACSVYAFTSHPDLPPYTRTDMCYTENPDGGYTISTGAGVKTAGY